MKRGVRKQPNGKRGAFTLPELMVVISIIAVLASLLFPVVVGAKARAKSTACTSNLSQIYRASLLYMADWNDTFPAGKDCLDVFAPVGYSPSGLERLKQTPLLKDLLHPYLRSFLPFRCPSDSGAAVSESAFPTAIPLLPIAFDACGMSYEYHTSLGLGAVSGTSLRNVSKVNVLEDLAGHWHGLGSITRPNDTPDTFYNRRVNYRYNVIYVDGHTRNVSYRAKENGWREN